MIFFCAQNKWVRKSRATTGYNWLSNSGPGSSATTRTPSRILQVWKTRNNPGDEAKLEVFQIWAHWNDGLAPKDNLMARHSAKAAGGAYPIRIPTCRHDTNWKARAQSRQERFDIINRKMLEGHIVKKCAFGSCKEKPLLTVQIIHEKNSPKESMLLPSPSFRMKFVLLKPLSNIFSCRL